MYSAKGRPAPGGMGVVLPEYEPTAPPLAMEEPPPYASYREDDTAILLPAGSGLQNTFGRASGAAVAPWTSQGTSAPYPGTSAPYPGTSAPYPGTSGGDGLVRGTTWNQNQVRYRRTSSDSSTDTAYGGEFNLVTDDTTCCTHGAVARANQFARTFRTMRKHNSNMAFNSRLLFPCGGSGSCGNFLTLLLEIISLVIGFGAPLLVIGLYFASISEFSAVIQMLPNLPLWTLFCLDFFLFNYFCVALKIHHINRRRFFSCPWMIKIESDSYILAGKSHVFREADCEEMCRATKSVRRREVIRSVFPRRNQHVLAMYYCSRYVHQHIERVSVHLTLYLVMHLVSCAAFLSLGVWWRQLIIP